MMQCQKNIDEITKFITEIEGSNQSNESMKYLDDVEQLVLDILTN